MKPPDFACPHGYIGKLLYIKESHVESGLHYYHCLTCRYSFRLEKGCAGLRALGHDVPV